ncbi:MAG: hypothetical protein NWE90_07350 [Candidatus Bathyarchaeota archaeon]|nr:hypothetical protein [Candidatus Bathyarchaeota archaeon]
MVKLKCSRKTCGHIWNYKGHSKFYTSCPVCKTTVNVKKAIVKES